MSSIGVSECGVLSCLIALQLYAICITTIISHYTRGRSSSFVSHLSSFLPMSSPPAFCACFTSACLFLLHAIMVLTGGDATAVLFALFLVIGLALFAFILHALYRAHVSSSSLTVTITSSSPVASIASSPQPVHKSPIATLQTHMRQLLREIDTLKIQLNIINYCRPLHRPHAANSVSGPVIVNQFSSTLKKETSIDALAALPHMFRKSDFTIDIDSDMLMTGRETSSNSTPRVLVPTRASTGSETTCHERCPSTPSHYGPMLAALPVPNPSILSLVSLNLTQAALGSPSLEALTSSPGLSPQISSPLVSPLPLPRQMLPPAAASISRTISVNAQNEMEALLHHPVTLEIVKDVIIRDTDDLTAFADLLPLATPNDRLCLLFFYLDIKRLALAFSGPISPNCSAKMKSIQASYADWARRVGFGDEVLSNHESLIALLPSILSLLTLLLPLVHKSPLNRIAMTALFYSQTSPIADEERIKAAREISVYQYELNDNDVKNTVNNQPVSTIAITTTTNTTTNTTSINTTTTADQKDSDNRRNSVKTKMEAFQQTRSPPSHVRVFSQSLSRSSSQTSKNGAVSTASTRVNPPTLSRALTVEVQPVGTAAAARFNNRSSAGNDNNLLPPTLICLPSISYTSLASSTVSSTSSVSSNVLGTMCEPSTISGVSSPVSDMLSVSQRNGTGPVLVPGVVHSHKMSNSNNSFTCYEDDNQCSSASNSSRSLAPPSSISQSRIDKPDSSRLFVNSSRATVFNRVSFDCEAPLDAPTQTHAHSMGAIVQRANSLSNLTSEPQSNSHSIVNRASFISPSTAASATATAAAAAHHEHHLPRVNIILPPSVTVLQRDTHDSHTPVSYILKH